MHDITVKSIDEVEPYAGKNAIPGIRFRTMRSALGVSAWGMNVLELDPGCTGYPEHDHEKDGQEEVYVVLEGMITLQIGDAEHTLGKGSFVRVAPQTKRKFVTKESGATLLAIGATPGRAYVAR